MCGIIGYIGEKEVEEILITGLSALEYRGYDSSGIATIEGNKIQVVKKKGKIAKLVEALQQNKLNQNEDTEEKIEIVENMVEKVIKGNGDGLKATQEKETIVKKSSEINVGIGHTRWATHGKVTDENAHPHCDKKHKIALVHNGIIDNYQELKESLLAEGYKFTSQTDTEVLVHLIDKCYKENSDKDFGKAIQTALQYVVGTYGLLVISVYEPDKIFAIRNGSPLVLGVGDNEMIIASDVPAIVRHTSRVIYLEDKEFTVISKDNFTTTNFDNKILEKEIEEVKIKRGDVSKGNYPHYMLKEIEEQPEAIQRTFEGRVIKDYGISKLGGITLEKRDFLDINRIEICASGTSYHAALVGKYIFEMLARIPCKVEIASEVRYKNPIVEKGSLFFAVSQSGETADVIEAMREIQRKGGIVMGICNVPGSTIARESDGGVFMHAGVEISVASTKCFTTELTVFSLLGLLFARKKDLPSKRGRKLIEELIQIPKKIKTIINQKEHIKKIAEKYYQYKNFLYMGRMMNYPVALEGALKLKEISYIHAEGYSAGEMKHGPIALISPETPSIFIIPKDDVYDKVMGNIEEVKARKGKVIAIATEGDKQIGKLADDVIYVPDSDTYLSPMLTIIPLQYFAYYIAEFLGNDIDQPKNLAKTVTVE